MEENKEETKPKNIEVSPEQWKELQSKLKMLEEVANKGRIFDYKSKNTPTNKAVTVKISEYNGKYIIGWRTLKFELGRNPATGRETFAGEKAEYELKLLDKEGAESVETVSGYSSFGSARYDIRHECNVLSKKETTSGELIYEVKLPNGKTAELEGRFVN